MHRLSRANTAISLQRLLSTENPSPLAALNGINCPDRFQAMITMIAVQLLATCFTLPPESERYSRPPASYRHRSFPSGSSSDPRLISSLRLHTHFRNSPALGHHARNSSPTLAWPGGRSGPSREERLAEDISRQRRLHKLGESQRLGKGVNSRRAWSKASSGEIERESGIVVTSTSLRRRSRSSNEMTTSHSAPCQRRKVDRLYGRPRRFDSPPAAMPSQTSGTQRARPIWRKSRLNGTGSHRWSFQPILRSEDHPVFIQPVKDHIIKRWRARRPYPRSVTSTARLDNRFTEPPRKQTRTSDISTTDLSLTTSGPSTESLISNAAPVRSSAPSPEAVELDLTAGAETHIRSNPFPAPSEPLGAHSSGTIMSPQPSSLLPSDPVPTLVDDDAPSYLPRNGTACRTPSRTDREHGEDGRALVQYRDLSALRTHRHTGISAVGKVAEWKH